ncbi:hypothetical protein SAMN05421770_103229 [Granulicella rosea]|uniref:Beta-glucuronidase C-terminal domain-containing protein n=1 Tax=Granulicella rosea TaxID=474952 RepID=A0A239IQR9_9BACT|nr:glycosyl hydrolase family 79 C-terminal domain-containing protein [Granulicella rosea]SNS95895.1 hypothetical protein SAMN05421770_103229 [Granulicella rosea]
MRNSFRSVRVLLPAILFTVCTPLSTACAQTTASFTVDPTATQTPVNTGFLGLSLDLAETKYMVGTSTSPNPIFRQLLTNLTTYQNGPLQMRELSDEAFTTDTTDAFTTLSNLYNATHTTNGGVKYFVGVDFAGDVNSTGGSNGTAAAQAHTIYSSLPTGSVLSYEVGNEPDLYVSPTRTGTWNYSTFKTQYENTVASIEAENTGIPMDAPVFSGGSNSFSTTTNINDFINSEQAHLGLFDLHYYAGNHCNGNSVAADYLMTSAAVNSTSMVSRPNNASTWLATLHGVSRSNFRIGEMNSIACQGQAGVSDTFQSALWFLDEAMSYAQHYVSGINLFTIAATSYYSPFQFTHSGTFPNYTYGVSKINPIYYGMIATAMMLQNNAALLPAITPTTSKNIVAYATLDASNNVRILLLNKEETSTGDGNVVITMTGGGNASLWKLLVTGNNYAASDYTNLSGSGDEITLGGLTFKGSTDGTSSGTQSISTVVPSNSVYTIPLNHSSAMVVKIPLS